MVGTQVKPKDVKGGRTPFNFIRNNQDRSHDRSLRKRRSRSSSSDSSRGASSRRRSRSNERDSRYRRHSDLDKRSSRVQNKFSSRELAARFEEKNINCFEGISSFEEAKANTLRFSPPDTQRKHADDKELFPISNLFNNQFVPSHPINTVSSGPVWNNSNDLGPVSLSNFSNLGAGFGVNPMAFDSNLAFQQGNVPMVNSVENSRPNLNIFNANIGGLNPQALKLANWNNVMQQRTFSNVETPLVFHNKPHFQYQGMSSNTWSDPNNVPPRVHENTTPTFKVNTGQTRFQEPASKYDVNIPVFNPEMSAYSAREWLQLIEAAGTKFDWKSDEKRYNMTSRLSGYARQWYLTAGEKVLNLNWHEFKRKFIAAFPTEMDFHSQLCTMINRKKDDKESMNSYFTHKLLLINTCQITGRRAVSCIIGGLPMNSLRNDAKTQNFDDPNQLYEFLRTTCVADENGKQSQSNITEMKQNVTNVYSPCDPVIFCHSCWKSGHTSKDCPKKVVTKCQFCDQSDHTEESCRNNPETLKSSQSAIIQVMYGALGNAPVDPDCFVNVIINRKCFRAYIDPGDIGSDCVTMREAAAKACNVLYRKMYKIVRGFRGSNISSHGEADVKLSVDRAIAQVKIFIVPDHVQAVSVVIGKSFLSQGHVVVVKKPNAKIRVYQRMDNGEINFDY